MNRAVAQLRNFARDELKTGKPELNIIQELVVDARSQLGRELTNDELDKIRYVVLDEKMKLKGLV